ncbi:MAG: hypothetical protein AO396_01440 [Candidatus Fermentibacter daniensis]|nr:MAG: hypothetical protein AO396_01440 [Candidatus Fermentibacter daniensis]
MVNGLEKFREHFVGFNENYVLIGGTACDIALGKAGIPFRRTKDLDIVLCVEALNREFVSAFWKFVLEGGYEHQQKSTGEKLYYRFFSPTDSAFPFMLELFSRVPDSLLLSEESHLTPIPVDDPGLSLSAILLDDDYYYLIHEGKHEEDGLSLVGHEQLIPLKARAWLDMTRRRTKGEDVDEKDIRKHRNDVFRLYQILDPDSRIDLRPAIREDLLSFLASAEADKAINLKDIGLGSIKVTEACDDIRRFYGID